MPCYEEVSYQQTDWVDFRYSHCLDLLGMPHDPTPPSKYTSSAYTFGGVPFTTRPNASAISCQFERHEERKKNVDLGAVDVV